MVQLRQMRCKSWLSEEFIVLSIPISLPIYCFVIDRNFEIF